MQSSSFEPPSNGKIFDAADEHQDAAPLIPQVRIHPDYLRNGRRSLAGIAEHALGIGIVLGVTMVITVQLLLADHYLWRIPFFVSTLAVFHFLEFEMTARYNTPDAKVSSFLIFSNGWAYNAAHSMAVVEVCTRYWLSQRSSQSRLLTAGFREPSGPVLSHLLTMCGILLIIAGQIIRSLAMKHAGTSFNHVVQSSQKEDHVLVTRGVYAFSRHPAYCGFFWWGLGTQLMLGNALCFIAYAVVLWKFFAHRTRVEERHLNTFFGKKYGVYRAATPVRIPFIP